MVALLVAASLTVITVDAASGEDSPIDPARAAVGEVIGPVEAGTATAVRPFRETVAYFAANDELRQDVAELSAQNSKLRSEAEQVPLDRNRLAELDGLTGTANQTGYALVAARVVGMGPMQSFSRTVTIDAGTTLGRPQGHDRAEQRRPGGAGDQYDAQHRERAAHPGHRLRRRRPARLQQRDRVPARARGHR